jgi:murein L,D-transpeptidase YafK
LSKRRLRFLQLGCLAAAVAAGVAFFSWSAKAFELPGFARPARLAPPHPALPRSTEGLLVKSLLQITQGQTRAALDTLDELTRLAPNFKLAHLVRGDLLMAHARALSGFGGAPEASKEAISDFREEARVRLEHYLTQQDVQNVPAYLWQLDPSQQYAIVIDASRSRLYLYRNESGNPRYVADYYVTVGKNGTEKSKEGDKRTPLGVYFASTQLQQQNLPDFYGKAAYPLSYPNEWDRRQGKNGHGIWLHGTPDNTYSRPPHASDGCVVMTNPDLRAMAPILKNGRTPVVIVHDIPAGTAAQMAAQKEDLAQAMEAWRRAWESQDTDRYLGYYSHDFFSPDRNYDGWAQEKRRIQSAGIKASIRLSNISMFRYPDVRQQMVVVSFDQQYNNGSLNNAMHKRQYWVLENGRWKILYEGAA